MQEEGFRSHPYTCKGGVLTVGYGTKASSVNDIIDEEEGKNRLRNYLENITYKRIEKYEVVYNQNQLIAVASFDFNTNKLPNILNKDHTINCDKILLYNKVKVQTEDGYKYVVNEGLNKRRIREYNLCKN